MVDDDRDIYCCNMDNENVDNENISEIKKKKFWFSSCLEANLYK